VVRAPLEIWRKNKEWPEVGSEKKEGKKLGMSEPSKDGNRRKRITTMGNQDRMANGQAHTKKRGKSIS
jgi:hypothetical protein